MFRQKLLRKSSLGRHSSWHLHQSKLTEERKGRAGDNFGTTSRGQEYAGDYEHEPFRYREAAIETLTTHVTGKEFGLGDHVAYFFKSNVERLAFVIPYMVGGLRKSERCVYVADENTVPNILDELKWAGIDAGAMTARGALSVVTKHDAYLRNGIFEPDRMIADLDRDVSFALQSGFSGLRIAAEMSWALDLPSALVHLCDYEQKLCRHWPSQLGGLCQYNETLFPADVVERIATCHCAVVRDGQLIRNETHVHKVAKTA